MLGNVEKGGMTYWLSDQCELNCTCIKRINGT